MARWSDGERAYPYPFSARRYDLPESRVGQLRTEDLGTAAWAARGRELNRRRDFDSLLPNPDAGRRPRWLLRDSLGRRLAIVERHSNRWDLHDPETNRRLYSDHSEDPDQLELQGVGCMADEERERRSALVAFRVNDRSELEEGESIVPFQLRGFIARAALPARNRRGQPVREGLERYDTGCGSSELAPGRSWAITSPGFESGADGDRFVGEDGIVRTYTTYNAKPLFGRGAIYVLANTTGVHGGGIVRGVAQVGDTFEELDRMAYCDPNVAEGDPRAQWSYGRIAGTRLVGWIPTRC